MAVLDIRPALVALLAEDAAVAATVEWSTSRASGGQRIFPTKLPQGINKPSVVYNRISGVGLYNMEGPAGLIQTTIQVDCWAQTSDAAVALADQVKNAIDGFSGMIAYGSDTPQATLYIGGIFFQTEREDYDDVPKLNRMSRDYVVWFNERP